MIDLDPSDISCIFSTLKYLLKFVQNNSVQPIITFDQPLFWKALPIIQASSTGVELREIVLMLDQFHTFMNLLGAIGTLMSGSGLSNILQQVFAENAVVHVLSGKTISRAFRGHLIIDTCLNSLLFSLLKSENKINEEEFTALSNLFDISNPSMLNYTNLKEVISLGCLMELHYTFEELKEKLEAASKNPNYGFNTNTLFLLQGNSSKLTEVDHGTCTSQPFRNVYLSLLLSGIITTLNQLSGTYKRC